MTKKRKKVIRVEAEKFLASSTQYGIYLVKN